MLQRHRILWDLTRGQRARYGAAILALGLSHVLLLAVPLVLRDAIGAVEAGRADARFLWGAAATIVGLTAAAGVLQYLRLRWAALAAEAVVRGIRDRLFGHLATLPSVVLDRADTGDLVQRCTSDVETVRVLLSGQIVEIARVVLLLVVLVPLLFFLDAGMALVSVALFPPIFLFAAIFFRRVQVLFREVDEAEGAMTTVLQENLTGIRVVRAFARQDFECAKFGESNARHRDRHYRLIRLLGRYWALSDVLCLGQVGLVLLFGGWWMAQGKVAKGDLVAFLFYAQTAVWPLRHLGRVLNDTGRALVALRRLGEILSEPDETDLELPGDPPRLRGAIEVKGLRFAFPGGGPVLRGLDLRVDEGQTLALLGPPGAGKSTIIQLLLRLYDWDEGSILLDGRDLRTLGRRFVRSQVGVVLQEPFLYSKTIGANVRVGRGAATDVEVEQAAEAAAVHRSIQEFERGYDTIVGERGVTLSGGQRQRVALARALVKDPPILVLDDALSAVDVETEAHILDALRRRRGRRTTILIAHRLSSTQHADRVVVLEGGAVVQSGTHEELLAEEGPYRRLWRIQGALEEEIAGEVRP